MMTNGFELVLYAKASLDLFIPIREELAANMVKVCLNAERREYDGAHAVVEPAFLSSFCLLQRPFSSTMKIAVGMNTTFTGYLKFPLSHLALHGLKRYGANLAPRVGLEPTT